MSNLGKGRVPFAIFAFPMSILKSYYVACRIYGVALMSLIFCTMSIGFMSHVGSKKWLCHPPEFKVQEPVGGRTHLIHSNLSSEI